MTPENQTLDGVILALIIAAVSSLGTLGLPAFWKWVNGKIETARRRENDTITFSQDAEKIEQQKDLALIRAQQVLEAEVTELRETKRLQAVQILEQATEISRLKNYEAALEEVRNQRRLLIEWIIKELEQQHDLNNDTLIKQLRNEVLILETMLEFDKPKDE